MKLFPKLLLTTLPPVFLFLVLAVGITYHFSKKAITEMAEAWLASRLAEAVDVVREQQDTLRIYGLADVAAGVVKAKMDAGRTIAAIEVGAHGYLFAVDGRGVITLHPDSAMLGMDVSDQPWFQALGQGKGRVTFAVDGNPVLALYERFTPWDWTLLVADPEAEIYGAAYRMRPYLIWLGLATAAVLAAVLMVLTRRLTSPLQPLIQGAERIGGGALDTRIVMRSGDEYGRLAEVFNAMAAELQSSYAELERRVVERTAELSEANARLTAEIEERRQMARHKELLQEQLLKAKKMEAIGTLAGGVAHDFNNLLMGIQGNASLVRMAMDPRHPHAERLEMIETFAQSGAKLTRQLLGYARMGKYEVRAVDINALTQRCADMFGRTRKELRIRSRYQEEVWTVEVDQGQIEQVLLNLLINAWQAMPEGGTIDLETRNVVLDEEYAAANGIAAGPFVKISVSDTGVGIEPALRERIFDPFFSTKTRQRGTGLGLASAYGIIKNHNGLINVYSEPGRGATFNIYLPASEKAAETPTTNLSTPLRGDETVLLVDDEPHVLEITQRMLTKLGYRVLTAGGGREALALARRHAGFIDLVVLDMIMPDMSRGDTYDQLKRFDPDLKVLLASGYSINSEAAVIMARGCNGFIQKPFTLQALSDEVRRVLAGED